VSVSSRVGPWRSDADRPGRIDPAVDRPAHPRRDLPDRHHGQRPGRGRIRPDRAARLSTLTIKDGTYNLGCIAAPGTDCGDTPPGLQRKYIEVGTIRGDGNTVWFIQNMTLKAKLTGCTPNNSNYDPASCRSNGSYRLTWKLTCAGLSMQNFNGLGDLTGQADEYFDYTDKPWKKIA
jgi:hypothetical protein